MKVSREKNFIFLFFRNFFFWGRAQTDVYHTKGPQKSALVAKNDVKRLFLVKNEQKSIRVSLFLILEELTKILCLKPRRS